MSRTTAVLPIALLFATSGVLHFITPDFFLRIVPTWVPEPKLAVAVSGAMELAGAVGLLFARTRALAGWGLILLLAAVFPANVYMLQQAIERGASRAASLILWARLPLQPLLMWWIWRAAIR